MVQNSDASWSHKAGELPPTLIDAINPDYASWALYQTQYVYYNGILVGINIVESIPNYYNSEIQYFAITTGG